MALADLGAPHQELQQELHADGSGDDQQQDVGKVTALEGGSCPGTTR
jgi:hypothetical protein